MIRYAKLWIPNAVISNLVNDVKFSYHPHQNHQIQQDRVVKSQFAVTNEKGHKYGKIKCMYISLKYDFNRKNLEQLLFLASPSILMELSP